jgi:hypothetical protein
MKKHLVPFARVALILAAALISIEGSAAPPKLGGGGDSKHLAPKKKDLPPSKPPGRPQPRTGAVMFFDLPACPPGWVEFTEGRGRFVVGLTPNGTFLGTRGVALADLEDRPVGRHTHAISDPGHDHGYTPPVWTSTGDGASKAGVGSPVKTSKELTQISLDDAGDEPGTNAPYVQLLVCRYPGTW